MEKKEWIEKLNEIILGNGIIEYPDDQDALQKDLEDFISQELDKAREDGREEGERSKSYEISGYFSQTEGEHLLERGKEYVIISREEYDRLSKLKQ